MTRILLSLWMIATLLAAGACGSTEESPAAPGKVRLFAAASAGGVMDEIKAAFQGQTGIQVQTSYAATSTLARQIENGAAADVFLSADEAWADFLQKKGLVAARRSLLGNRLVVIVPPGSKAELAGLEDLLDARFDRLALAEPDSAPAGKYAKEALTKLGLWEKLRGKVVAAQDVRQALFFVETGNAAAGIVYATDAAASRGVRTVLRIDPRLTTPVRYPLVLLKQRGDDRAAKALYDYLQGPEAAEVFREHGFVVLTSRDN